MALVIGARWTRTGDAIPLTLSHHTAPHHPHPGVAGGNRASVGLSHPSHLLQLLGPTSGGTLESFQRLMHTLEGRQDRPCCQQGTAQWPQGGGGSKNRDSWQQGVQSRRHKETKKHVTYHASHGTILMSAGPQTRRK